MMGEATAESGAVARDATGRAFGSGTGALANVQPRAVSTAKVRKLFVIPLSPVTNGMHVLDAIACPWEIAGWSPVTVTFRTVGRDTSVLVGTDYVRCKSTIKNGELATEKIGNISDTQQAATASSAHPCQRHTQSVSPEIRPSFI